MDSINAWLSNAYSEIYGVVLGILQNDDDFIVKRKGDRYLFKADSKEQMGDVVTG